MLGEDITRWKRGLLSSSSPVFMSVSTKGVYMPKHVKSRPAKGSKKQAVKLNGAAVIDNTEHGHGVQDAHTKCDPPNPIGDKLVALAGVLAVLTLSTIAFIALHRWGIDDSHSMNFLIFFTAAVMPQQG